MAKQEKEKLTKGTKKKKSAKKKSDKVLAGKKETKILTNVESRSQESSKERYFQAIGRRKTSVARVRLFTKGEREFLINQKPYENYFKEAAEQETITSPLVKMKCLGKFGVKIIVKGGGKKSQSEAVRHGIARALVIFNNNFRKRLRKSGYLTRDPRMRERKKFGLKRARRSPQWSKR